MKKLRTLFALLLALTVFTVGLGTANATPVDELTELSEFVPADAPLFAIIRTDQAYIEALDGLLDQVIANFPPNAVPPLTVESLLEDFVADVSEGALSFSEDLRPWVGDSLGVVVSSFEAVNASTPINLLVDLADYDTAEAFFEASLPLGDGYTREEGEDGSIRYIPDFSEQPTYVLYEEVLFIGTPQAGLNQLLAPGADAVGLNQSENFQATIAALPTDDYNILAYINPDVITEPLLQFLPFILSQAGVPPTDLSMLEDVSLGQQALGFTLLEGRSLVMDYAAINGPMVGNDPLNMALLDLLPDDTALVVHGQGIGSTINFLFAALELLDSALTEFGVWPLDQAPAALADLGADDLGVFIRLTVEGTFNIDLEETLAWMSDDVVVAAGATLNEDMMLGVEAVSTTIISTDNPEATAELVEGIAALATNAFAPATFEDGMLTIPVGTLISQPELGVQMITSTDEFFISGTANAVNFALGGDGDALTSTEGYAFESGLFLPEPTSLLYIDMAPIREAANAAIAASGMIDPEGEEAIIANTLLSIIETSSVTIASNGDSSTARFTLTVSE